MIWPTKDAVDGFARDFITTDTGYLRSDDDYEYAFYVTNTAYRMVKPPTALKNVATAKNTSKETQYDMNVAGLLLKSFWTNEAVFQLMLLAYNIFLLFKFDRLVPQEYRQQIKAFRLKHLFVAGRIISTGRSTILKLAFDYKKGLVIENNTSHKIFLMYYKDSANQYLLLFLFQRRFQLLNFWRCNNVGRTKQKHQEGH